MDTRVALAASLALVAAVAISAPASGVHSRPDSGTPFRVSLVTAYEECFAPNSTHVEPLPFPSCTPPLRASPILTTGGRTGGGMFGFARFNVICTDGAPPPCEPPPPLPQDPDQEDVFANFTLTDVRCAVGGVPGCSSAGADYTGMVIEQSVLRITDHSSNGSPCADGGGGPPCVTATMQDFSFSLPVACVSDGGPKGSTCNLVTTLDTAVPTMVKERQRGVLEAFNVHVLDAGPDGDIEGFGPLPCPPACGTGDEYLYANQGIFLP